MKKYIFLLSTLFITALMASPFVFADADTPGSSTDPSALQGSGNTGKTVYTNVHNGNQVTASSHVAATDAVRDRHPFAGPGGGGGNGD